MIRENQTRTLYRWEQAYLSCLAKIRREAGDGQYTLRRGGEALPRFSQFSTHDGYSECYG